jgi:cell division protease FtsH
MADRTPTPRTPPSRDFDWGRFSKTLSFWLLLFIVPMLIYQWTGAGKEQASEVDYSLYSQQLDLDNITSVTIEDGKVITGDFRAKVRVPARDKTAAHDVSKFIVRLPVANDPKEAERLRSKNVMVRSAEGRQGIGTYLLPISFLLMFGLWIYIIRQMQAGGAKAFSFGKSKAKLLSGESPKVTFLDVAGVEEAKEELQEIIEFLKDPQKFTRLGGRLPKGVLLVGSPGTGKTLLARAVAGEAGRPFFSMSGSDFVEMFVGVGASRVRDLFEQGKAHAPCIIFIDEIDAVGRHRGAGLGGGHDEREQTLNQLLVEMDGFESNEGVILIAATNRPDVLDPALLRPGRFDRQVVVDLPDLRGREEILKVHLRKVPVSDDVQVALIARGTPGMSGADLANLVNEAALLAARHNHDKVYPADLEEAKDKVMLGAERKSMVMKDSEKRMTAYHEAGHAVCAIKTPGCDPMHKVTIMPRGRALGMAVTLASEDRYSVTRQQLLASLVQGYGGRVAEELTFGRDNVTTGAQSDIQKVTSLARRYVSQWGLSEAIGPILVGDNEHEVFLGRDMGHRREVSEKTAQIVDGEVTRLLGEAYERARKTLVEHTDLLKRMAEALLERETLNSEEIDALVRGEILPPRPAAPPGPLAAMSPANAQLAKPPKTSLLGGPEVAPA